MKKIFALTILVSLLETSLDAATVAYYRFNGTGTAAVDTVISDLAGTHHGTVTGGDLVYGTDPLVGGYMKFDADGGDRIVVPHAADLVFTTDQTYTFEAVFRTTQSGSVLGALLSKGCDVSNPDSQYWIRHQGNGTIRGLIEGLDNTSEDNATSTTAIMANDGTWHHMALVFDGTLATKRLQIFIDGTLLGTDSAIGTVGVVGGAEADPLIIGEFASLNATRSFAGDIAAVRLSDSALTPAEFLQVAATYIANVTPADGSSFLPDSTVAGFQVKSPSIGVETTGIKAVLNGTDISSQLTITGTSAERNVTLPALAANRIYNLAISVTDLAGNKVTESVAFNTFSTGLFFIEGEDYNFGGGQFIANPLLTSIPGPQSYLDRLGTEGIDYHQTNETVTSVYRINDRVGTIASQDALRQAYIDAQVTDPAVMDYLATQNGNTEWLNYTRTFPANTYRVYARAAKSGTAPIVISLDEVTAGSSSVDQTLSPIGLVKGEPTGAAQTFAFIPLVDALGKEIAVKLNGTKTIRASMLSGTLGLNLNYLLFVPAGEAQPPYLTSVTPASGADNELANPTIQATIRNGDSQVTASSIGMKLNGTTVTPTVTPTALGATVSYTPSTLSTGLYTVSLFFSDSASSWTTNEWKFRVANQAVRAHWTFDEKVPGSTASTEDGAFLDLSGNERNGTSSSVPPVYVSGSSEYGNSSALRFSGTLDRMVVPDLSGSFNFAGSFTMEALIRTTNTVAGGALLAKNGTDGEGEYWWRMPGAGGKSQQIAMNGKFVAGTNVINDGQWHHVAAVYDATATEIRIYFDYQLEGGATAVVFATPVGRPNDLTVGSFLNGGSEFEGDVDFIRISSAALATSEFVQPAPSLEAPVINALGITGGNISFSFQTQANRTYKIHSATTPGGAWDVIETFTATGGPRTVSYSAASGQKFYRVSVE